MDRITSRTEKSLWCSYLIMFDHAKSKFKLTWWSSTGTFTVQGNEKICHDIVKKVQNLVDDKAENSVKTGETTKAGKQKRENPSKLDEIELKVNEFESHLGDELKKMWLAIESIQRASNHASKSECKQKDVLAFPNVPTSNRFQYLILKQRLQKLKRMTRIILLDPQIIIKKRSKN